MLEHANGSYRLSTDRRQWRLAVQCVFSLPQHGAIVGRLKHVTGQSTGEGSLDTSVADIFGSSGTDLQAARARL